MGPVVKTYGGYKPKRKGLPKYVVKESLETTGNVFSALHIDNLKAIRGGDNHTSKTNKVTKANIVREVQPTFDDSLDSTFDKILKSDKNKPSNEASSHLDLKKMYGLDSSNQCWTCGCIPATNMAHHVLFECKEDSYYKNPSPRTKRIVAHKLKQQAEKNKKKKLELPKSTISKPLKSHVKKGKTVRRAQFRVDEGFSSPAVRTDNVLQNHLLNVDNVDFTSTVESPFKTPHCKGSWLCETSRVFVTSTPDGFDKGPKFSIQTSPIFVDHPVKKMEDQEHPVQLAENVQNNSYKHTDNKIGKNFGKFSGVLAKPLTDEKRSEKECGEPEVLANTVSCEQKLTEGFCRLPSLPVDDVQSEQSVKHSEVKRISCAVKSYDPSFIESSFVRQSQLHRPSGYITKRRMWRKTRRTAINLSVDMFKSITNTTFDDHLSNVDVSSVVDKLQAVTSKNDKSFLGLKGQSFIQQPFSISLELDEDMSVKVTKSDGSCVKTDSSKSNMEHANITSICETSDGGKALVKHSNVDTSIHELSKELKVSLTFLSPKNIKKSICSNYESDVDMFSELSKEKSKCLFQSFKSNKSLFSEQMCASPILKTNSKLPELLASSSLNKNIANPATVESVESLSNDISLKGNLDGTEFIRESSLRLDESVMSFSDNSFGEELSVSNDSVAKQSLNVGNSLRQNLSSNSDVYKVNDNLFEVVLKPCYVKLRRIDTQTIADVTYASQSNMSVIQDCQVEDMVYSTELQTESDQSSSSDTQSSTNLNTVVQLPLLLLGKLDKITIRGCGSSKISQSSFISFVQDGKLLEETLEKLEELQTEYNEAAEVPHEFRQADKSDLDFREVLSRCDQTEPLPFASCYPESMLPKCKKIGEGAYGEVFLYNAEKQKTVIKIIPIEGDIEINAAVQKKFGEIKPEIIVAQELSALRKSKTGSNSCDIFNEVLAVRCVRGKYPQWMLDLWHTFDEEKGSDNDCPDVFGDDQLFIVLELAHGGEDLESYQFTSADQAEAAITQIAFALAVGESEIQFEHRDLHWGNVLVAPTKAKTVQFTLNGEKYKVPTKGVKVSVIDFTMSRMKMPANGENMFYDFGHDEELFSAEGDYQCDIYRLMRERTRNNWSVYEPFTNILWLHYLLDKMCSMVAYRNQNTKIHQKAMVKLENMRDAVLAYSGATAFSLSEFFKSSKAR